VHKEARVILHQPLQKPGGAGFVASVAQPHRRYEFGVKVSVATTLKGSKGGRFAIHAPALPSNPYDGHTLARINPAIDRRVGNKIDRAHTDAGYRGRNAPPEYRCKV
jgi:IS5 family transposase